MTYLEDLQSGPDGQNDCGEEEEAGYLRLLRDTLDLAQLDLAKHGSKWARLFAAGLADALDDMGVGQ